MNAPNTVGTIKFCQPKKKVARIGQTKSSTSSHTFIAENTFAKIVKSACHSFCNHHACSCLIQLPNKPEKNKNTEKWVLSLLLEYLTAKAKLL